MLAKIYVAWRPSREISYPSMCEPSRPFRRKSSKHSTHPTCRYFPNILAIDTMQKQAEKPQSSRIESTGNCLPCTRPLGTYTSTPCRLVLEGRRAGTIMDAVAHEVKSWIAETLGEESVEISVWAQDDDFVQLLLRLSDRVAIMDLSTEGGEIIEEDSLIIRQSQWQPNSIQTRRMSDGFVRIRHRSNDILLAPRVAQSPDWASNLLETWLKEIRGESHIPKTRQQRLSSLKRTRDRVEKLLDQANLSDINDEVRYVEFRLDSADYKLAGDQFNYSSSEE